MRPDIVAEGSLQNLLEAEAPSTVRYPSRSPLDPHTAGAPQRRQPQAQPGAGADATTFRTSIRIPLGRLVCITGVSGSGKSTR